MSTVLSVAVGTRAYETILERAGFVRGLGER
jgi:hypothetical protein